MTVLIIIHPVIYLIFMKCDAGNFFVFVYVCVCVQMCMGKCVCMSVYCKCVCVYASVYLSV